MQGADVVLTIQADLQQFIEEAFIYRAGSVVVLEPQTGRVLALFSKPGFDLNLFSPAISRREWEQLNSDPLHPLENRAIRGLYSPASSFKLVVAAAALAEKAVEPSEQLTCEGVLEMGEQSFRCWKRTGHGSVDLRRAIVESCDIYFYKLGLRLGPDIIARHALLFGFGKPTGLGLPQELPGLIPTPAWKQRTLGDSWKEGETVTMSIGQGYVVSTPIQMAAMTAAIANGGDLMKPAIVQGIRGPDGRMVYRHVPVIKQKLKLSRQSLTFLQQSMKEVVSSPRGTGKQCRLPDLQVAGKTGTSQVIRLRQGSEQTDKIPYHERTHAIFVGYVDDMPKQIALAVVVEHGGKGGSTAAPLARRIIAHYYGLSDIPATPVSGATD
jgi:penicillin-binding protein 2